MCIRDRFTTEFARYETLPEMLVPAVVEQAKKLGNLDAVSYTHLTAAVTGIRVFTAGFQIAARFSKGSIQRSRCV